MRTYAIFNYEWMGWTTHTEAGGDTTEGQGGVPAFVGFNAGNGTKAYEYKPYSQVCFNTKVFRLVYCTVLHCTAEDPDTRPAQHRLC